MFCVFTEAAARVNAAAEVSDEDNNDDDNDDSDDKDAMDGPETNRTPPDADVDGPSADASAAATADAADGAWECVCAGVICGRLGMLEGDVPPGLTCDSLELLRD
mmetsp:Transcript_43816/g.52995  ORF Transcript_43816/g.52995 Transcript_43816/m.52995 type:complete len:105 (-) Transcript_43816:22-336(-)|eukprot:CAMPEP_0197849922 /NCGR_PEP_ID=MMETSP1438-20131217/13665_1 /TAXON_ID=1461541 /ORGANISM="Pterosperma sp., Strain CCMP1384" /LENGTH=104 /DNA_ID=CAMNT_0043462827 /DNA_START=330 /DNA_END=644 /DNA_ORIENTATION=-